MKPRLFIFLDIYEMPSFVDNYEMLSFVAICEMLSFFRYILDVECFPIFEMNSCMFIV